MDKTTHYMTTKSLLTALLIAVFGLTSWTMEAQNDLFISKVFDTYGKKLGVEMVDISGEMLENYRLTRFRSITIKNDPEAADFARKCLARDQTGAKKIKEVTSNGVPTSVYLQLPRLGNNNRLILYNENRNKVIKITLIYIESKDDTESILKLLLQKK
jgi:hypothetical protein